MKQDLPSVPEAPYVCVVVSAEDRNRLRTAEVLEALSAASYLRPPQVLAGKPPSADVPVGLRQLSGPLVSLQLETLRGTIPAALVRPGEDAPHVLAGGHAVHVLRDTITRSLNHHPQCGTPARPPGRLAAL